MAKSNRRTAHRTIQRRLLWVAALAGCVTLALLFWAKSTDWAGYLSWLIFLNIATFLAFAIDKRQAGRGGERVAERTLYLSAIAGGFLGIWIGVPALPHKSSKPSFLVRLVLATLIHLSATLLLLSL